MSEPDIVEKTFPATLDAIEEIAILLEEMMDTAGVEMMDAARIQLAVEEAVTNVVKHGYQGKSGDVTVRLEILPDTITIQICDSGQAFDPTSIPPADVTADLDHRKIGGLGVHLIRSVMDTLTYSREGDKNRIFMAKKFK
jgi:sigma-B regulation protein RsbU (phosphoserine phosphatase)